MLSVFENEVCPQTAINQRNGVPHFLDEAFFLHGQNMV